MSDHCKTCLEDFDDLVGFTTEEDWQQGLAACVLCEGCGPTQVDPEGYCLGGCWGDWDTKEPHSCRHCPKCSFHGEHR